MAAAGTARGHLAGTLQSLRRLWLLFPVKWGTIARFRAEQNVDVCLTKDRSGYFLRTDFLCTSLEAGKTLGRSMNPKLSAPSHG